MTIVMWLIVITAAVGFLFDTYPLLMTPLVVPPALAQLSPFKPGSAEFNAWSETWKGILFYVPALTGGLFGLLGGYLTDLFGRRRMLVWSILLYAGSAFASGFSTSVWWLLLFRSTTFIGVCIEFVAAVAWLAELFPNPHQRETVLGYTQVFGSLGGLLVAAVNHQLADYIEWLPALPLVGEPGAAADHVWRWTLISGVIPAIPLIVVRPFLPESPAWQQKKLAGTLRRPSFAELFAPGLRQTTVVAAVLFACTLGVAFGAIQQAPPLVRTHPDLKALSPKDKGQQAAVVQTYQEVGGLMGRVAIAVLFVRIASRRTLLRMFLVPGLIVLPLVFMLPSHGHLDWFKWGMFAAGFFTVAQLSFWGNYLPRVYPTHLRGTGESFSANLGGRMIGTSAALVTTQLALYLPGAGDSFSLATAAAWVGGAIYLLALVASCWLPEPPSERLAE